MDKSEGANDLFCFNGREKIISEDIEILPFGHDDCEAKVFDLLAIPSAVVVLDVKGDVPCEFK